VLANRTDLSFDLPAFSTGPPGIPSPRSEKLSDLRRLYEPQAFALSRHFMMSLPSWISDEASQKNWKVSVLTRDEVPFAVSDPFADSPLDDEPLRKTTPGA